MAEARGAPAARAAEVESSTLARIAAAAAVAIAIALVAVFLFGGETGYTVKARFLNAGQLVTGNLVEVGGTQAGSVTGFEITSDGQAEVEMTIDEKYAPLRSGTRALIRQGSQSSVANKYIELHLPPENQAGGPIADGGMIPADKTTTSVELDQFFNMLDRPTRKGLRGFHKGLNRLYAGRGEEANAGLRYLSPQLEASTRLFRELTYDKPALERFLIDSSRLVGALAERRDDLSALVGNLNSTTRALGSEKLALAEAIERFPGFMRTANTTYVNLRAALDDVDPFVRESKPVAKKLGPYLDELRPFAREAVPTVRNLARLTRFKGAGNDLVELNRTYPALADIAVDTMDRTVEYAADPVNVGRKRGAFPEMTQAFKDSAPIVAHGRPYTPDFLAWFDDFSHTGMYDALGSVSRTQAYFNAFLVTEGGAVPIPLEERGENFRQLAKINSYKRCPGASEEKAADDSNVFSEAEQEELDCVEAHRATGALTP